MIELKIIMTTQKQMFTWFYCASLFSSTKDWCTMLVCSYAGLGRKPHDQVSRGYYFFCLKDETAKWTLILGSNQSPFIHTILADINIFRTWLNVPPYAMIAWKPVTILLTFVWDSCTLYTHIRLLFTKSVLCICTVTSVHSQPIFIIIH